MSKTVALEVNLRSRLGTREARRLRREGIVPCNLFGHKQDPVPLRVPGAAIRSLLSSGARVVDLQMDGKTEKALFVDVQWDTFGQHVLHVDFQRIDPDERVQVYVPVHTRGTAPGVLNGGILEQPHHEVEVECLAVEIPEEFMVRINSLDIGQAIHVSDLEVPPGVTVLLPAEDVVLQVVEPMAVPEELEEAAEEEAAEPELVRREEEEGEGGEE